MYRSLFPYSYMYSAMIIITSSLYIYIKILTCVHVIHDDANIVSMTTGMYIEWTVVCFREEDTTYG